MMAKQAAEKLFTATARRGLYEDSHVQRAFRPFPTWWGGFYQTRNITAAGNIARGDEPGGRSTLRDPTSICLIAPLEI
jgi:hypothetical protein